MATGYTSMPLSYFTSMPCYYTRSSNFAGSEVDKTQPLQQKDEPWVDKWLPKLQKRHSIEMLRKLPPGFLLKQDVQQQRGQNFFNYGASSGEILEDRLKDLMSTLGITLEEKLGEGYHGKIFRAVDSSSKSLVIKLMELKESYTTVSWLTEQAVLR